MDRPEIRDGVKRLIAEGLVNEQSIAYIHDRVCREFTELSAEQVVEQIVYLRRELVKTNRIVPWNRPLPRLRSARAK